MDTNGKSESESGKEITKREPRTLKFSDKGIRTSKDFANCMSALMADLIDGRVGSETGNAICNAGGKLLKMIELEHKFGNIENGVRKGGKTLLLASEDE